MSAPAPAPMQCANVICLGTFTKRGMDVIRANPECTQLTIDADTDDHQVYEEQDGLFDFRVAARCRKLLPDHDEGDEDEDEAVTMARNRLHNEVRARVEDEMEAEEATGPQAIVDFKAFLHTSTHLTELNLQLDSNWSNADVIEIIDAVTHSEITSLYLVCGMKAVHGNTTAIFDALCALMIAKPMHKLRFSVYSGTMKLDITTVIRIADAIAQSCIGEIDINLSRAIYPQITDDGRDAAGAAIVRMLTANPMDAVVSLLNLHVTTIDASPDIQRQIADAIALHPSLHVTDLTCWLSPEDLIQRVIPCSTALTRMDLTCRRGSFHGNPTYAKLYQAVLMNEGILDIGMKSCNCLSMNRGPRLDVLLAERRKTREETAFLGVGLH